MPTRALLLGVDGGGSKTTALLATAEGELVGRGSGPACNYQSVGAEAAWSALDEAVRAAWEDSGQEPVVIAAACLGLAGAARAVDRALFEGWIAERLPGAWGLVVNDAELVLAAGTPEGWGVALISGTGSIAYGRAPDGRSARRRRLGLSTGRRGQRLPDRPGGLARRDACVRRPRSGHRVDRGGAGPLGS